MPCSVVTAIQVEKLVPSSTQKFLLPPLPALLSKNKERSHGVGAKYNKEKIVRNQLVEVLSKNEKLLKVFNVENDQISF